MALASIYRVVQDVQGNIVTEVLGTITQSGTSTLAALFSDAAGVNPLPNPLINNPTYGSYNVFVGAGSYDMAFLKVGYTFETQRNIVLRDPASGVNTLTGTANQVIVTPASGIGAVTLSLPQSIAPDSAVQFARLGLGTPADATASLAVPGRTTLGGHASTGVLDVQSSVAASDLAAGNYVAVRAWPIAPAGAFCHFGMRIDPPTGATVGGAHARGIAIMDTPSTVATAYALDLNYTGTAAGRFNVYAQGNAPNFFAGNVGIANAVPSYPLDVTGHARVMGQFGVGNAAGPNEKCRIDFDKNIYNALVFQARTNDLGGGAVCTFLNIAGAAVGSITHNASATQFNTSSDVRLKHAVQALGNALSAIQALRPVRFRWNATDDADEGFLAHELQQVIPHAVTGEPDAVNEDGSVRPQQVDHSKLVVWLVGAVQELAARLDAAGA